MSIKNLQAFTNNLWDWAIFDGCFGNTRIKPTDIDGLVEKRGHFLWLEAKSPGKSIPLGQEIMFKNLRADGRHTIFVIWGDVGKPERLRIYQPHPKPIVEEPYCDLPMLRAHVSRWYADANSRDWRLCVATALGMEGQDDFFS
jgi:hypothetical protein